MASDSNVPMDDEGFVTVREAADFLALSRAKLYALMEARELRYAKFGRARRIPRSALREYAKRSLIGS